MQGGSAFPYGNAAGVRNERMSEECTHDCSSCGAACSSRDAAPKHDAPNPNSSVKKVIGVVSGKGGVGKSMTSALLACGLPAFEAAACAVYLHGAVVDGLNSGILAGDIAPLASTCLEELRDSYQRHFHPLKAEERAIEWEDS